MDVMARRRAIMAHIARLVKKIISSVTGLVSFKTNVEEPVKVTCEFSPVQADGTPSHDNPLPISGWTGCEISKARKNLLKPVSDSEFWQNGYIRNDGTVTADNAYRVTDFISIRPGIDYTFFVWQIDEITSFDGWKGIAFYDGNKTFIPRSFWQGTISQLRHVVSPDNAMYVRVYTVPETCPQLGIETTVTAYEPYQGEHFPINWKLPDEYQEVEFITANGNQYFWSDVLIQDGLTVDSKQSFNGGDSYLFGGHADNTGNNRCAYSGHYASRVQSAYPDYFLAGAVTSDGTVFHIITTFKEGHRTIYIDGVNVMDDSRGTAVQETGKYCVVFGQRSKGDDMPGTVSNTYRGSLYSLKVSKNSVLLADYVPCYRKADSKPGMYDLVTGTFYVNQGTGDDFTVGPDVSTLPGTVYGGTVTLNEDGSADLVSDYVYLTINDLTKYSTPSDRSDSRVFQWYNRQLNSIAGWKADIICEILKSDTNLNLPNVIERNGIYVYTTVPVSSEVTTHDQFKAVYGNYHFAVPANAAQTYHFDNIGQLQSFLGTNNIWHNMNGSITAEYYKKQ